MLLFALALLHILGMIVLFETKVALILPVLLIGLSVAALAVGFVYALLSELIPWLNGDL